MGFIGSKKKHLEVSLRLLTGWSNEPTVKHSGLEHGSDVCSLLCCCTLKIKYWKQQQHRLQTAAAGYWRLNKIDFIHFSYRKGKFMRTVFVPLCDVIAEHGYALCFRLGPHGANKSEDLMKSLFFKMWNFFRLTGEVFSFFLVNLPFFLTNLHIFFPHKIIYLFF